ncbi:hypothetical protein SS1G_00253 [Sclerotinia sclerotiorum 1980 UF-70]|uniref:Uncharacterized protein n=1 Tax=Sclerotinia sclerotiorum (strain ATCC 18683 / 1980 / Ss-1) TaxID=665079 RepID=A7E4N1_SCLS1|nr:hypothetical protein SS1G_00253 [Sclerotinia sclerotiorum 1980 UF-70]EDN90853.1 hypothetical protein SS1G_00253 [Sclerotinia sclerotiorum 1980 UF-70]
MHHLSHRRLRLFQHFSIHQNKYGVRASFIGGWVFKERAVW